MARQINVKYVFSQQVKDEAKLLKELALEGKIRVTTSEKKMVGGKFKTRKAKNWHDWNIPMFNVKKIVDVELGEMSIVDKII